VDRFLLIGETGSFAAGSSSRKQDSADPCIFGYFEGGCKFEDRPVTIVVYGCLALERSAVTVNDLCPGGENTFGHRS